MNNISGQVMSVINQIAEKFGVAAEKVYPLLVKQAQYHATMDMVWIIVLSILLVASIIGTVWFIKKVWQDCEDIGLTAIVAMIPMICIAVLVVPLVDCVTEFIQIKVNPEYFIFQMVSKLIK